MGYVRDIDKLRFGAAGDSYRQRCSMVRRVCRILSDDRVASGDHESIESAQHRVARVGLDEMMLE